jgi:hypothetical protein
MQKNRLIAFLLCFVLSINAQFLVDWQQSFDGSRNDFAESINFDSEGNIIISGTSFDGSFMPDAVIIKYSPDGDFLWSQTYNIGPEDRPIGVYFDAEDNIIMGVIGADSSIYQDDFHIVKISKDGQLLFGHRVAWYIQPNYDIIAEARAKELYADNFGNLVLGGPSSNGKFWMVKLDYDGNVVSKSLDTLATVKDYYVEEYNTFFNPSTGHLYFGCQFVNSSLGNNHYGIVQMDNGGNILNYNKLFHFGYKYMYTQLVDYAINSSNQYYLALDIHNQNVFPDSVNYFPRLTCIGNNGEFEWDTVIPASPGFDTSSSITSIDLDIGGNIWATGSKDGKAFVGKFSGAGETAWLKTMDTPWGEGQKIACDERSAAVAYWNENTDVIIEKFNQFGEPQTSFFIQGDGVYIPAYLNDMVFDENHILYTTGSEYGSNWNIETRKIYDQAVSVDDNNIVNTFSLMQNYPNPFNPSTSIEYSVPRNENVTLKVFDMLGREVATLVNKQMNPGNYKVEFDASQLSSGIYFYKMTADNFNKTMKMLLLK